MSGIFKKGATAAPTFDQGAQENVIDPLTGSVNDFFANWNPNQSMNLPGQSQGNVNPLSFINAGAGNMGEAASLFNMGADQIGTDPFGAGGFFSNVLSDDFTNLNNPQVQGVLDAMVNQSQRGFNIGADKIASSAAMAGGGLGSSTARTDSLGRLGADISAQLSDQTANFLQGELARRQGLQLAAGQQALGEGLRRSEAYGNIASGLGSLGLGRSQFGGNLQNQFFGQDMAGANLPLETMFRLAGLLKSGSAVPQNSWWDNINQVANTGGQVAGAIATMSDEKTKTNVVPVSDEDIDTFLKNIVPVNFEYKHAPGEQKFGVMAQDLEKTKIGKSMVFEKEGVKYIDVPSAVGTILMVVARMDQRLKERGV